MSVNKRKYMTISSCLLEPFEDYSLVYYTDVTKVVNEWNKNNFSLFGAVTIFSGILSICLAILLESLFKPLEKISLSSARIADGAYEEKLDIKGEGEIGEVVRSFNRMSDKIKEQMQVLHEYAEEKQRLIDNLAHELKTPLTAIYGYGEYIQKTNLDEKKKYTATQFILRESKRIENISKMLLEMAVLREEKEVEMKVVDIETLFERIYQIEESKLKAKGIEIIYSLQFKKLYGNEDLLEGLLINLIDNAIRACGEEGGKIGLKSYEQGGQRRIEISDNGKGMTKEQMSHITEPFYRADKARSRKDGGNGLGLALCDEIAKKHGAQLVFDSTLGEGTIVKIVFPSDKIEQMDK